MKKIFIILSLMLLCACSAGKTGSSISNGNDVLFTGPNVSYTKQNLYDSLKVSSSDALVNDIVNNIAKKENVDFDTIEKEAQEMIDEYIANGYDSYIIAYYGSTDAYKKSYIDNKVLEELSKNYVKENYEKTLANDMPIKMQMASFIELSDAEKFLEDLNNGSTFDMAALNNNTQSEPISSVYTDTDTTLPLEVKEYLNSNSDLGVSPIITITTTTTDSQGQSTETNTYYVVNVESRNDADFRDEYIALAANNVTVDTLYDHLFTKYKIEFFDQDIYNLVTSNYEVLK